MNPIVLIINQIQRIALYAYFFSINFEVWDPFNTNGYFSLSKLTGLIYLVTIIPQIKHFIRTDRIKPFIQPAWIFFALLTFVSLININSISNNFIDFTIFQNILLFWFLINHERKDRLVLEKGMLSFALGSIALAFLFYAGIGIEYRIEYGTLGRVSIFGDNENIVGLRMCISLVILVLTIIQNRLNLGRLRYLLLLPIPIMIRLMFATGSRVAFISFFLLFLTGVILFKTKRIWHKIALIAMSSGALIYIWQLLMHSETLIRRLTRSSQEYDLAGRDAIWQGLLPLVENHPILGVGTTGYAFFTQKTFGRWQSPHNVILEVLCYTGIIGLMIYLIFLYRVFKRGYQNYKTEGFLLSLLLLIPVMGILASGQILGVKIGWAIFAYVGCSSFYKSKIKRTGGTKALTIHKRSFRHRIFRSIRLAASVGGMGIER
jgi:O-antigen ligase